MNGNERDFEGEGTLDVCEFIRLLTRPGDMIADPFLGRGSLEGCADVLLEGLLADHLRRRKALANGSEGGDEAE